MKKNKKRVFISSPPHPGVGKLQAIGSRFSASLIGLFLKSLWQNARIGIHVVVEGPARRWKAPGSKLIPGGSLLPIILMALRQNHCRRTETGPPIKKDRTETIFH